ncbi:SnoaL-like domain-containing protein [Asanoa hainanensis]|uniref:SnoaL-like domain-containing protein n=1 Tax=Asanoa hainanensis TaxID=560556 RepID=A0A239PGR4_9ACTN|nr:nuclear transport factor 2 family protein [Asanoa hainanensis]SNT65774.1 SnoaL-like domain-containing protein [Asanoa hainanensis]
MNLPDTITAYLKAHQARDVETALAVFTSDAVVRDDGHTHRGTAEIRDWLGGAAVEYTFTTELTGASRVDAEHYDVRQRLEGDFPGGVVDLHFRFTLRGGAVSELVIEP